MSLEREEAERAELRKMILGQSDKKPQINQPDQQQTSSQGKFAGFTGLGLNFRDYYTTPIRKIFKKIIIVIIIVNNNLY